MGIVNHKTNERWQQRVVRFGQIEFIDDLDVSALQKTSGRLWPTGWWHLLKALKWRHENTVEMLLVGVRPDYQGMGVNALFFDDLIPIYNQLGFKWAETGPQLEDNVRELSQWKPLKPEFVKRRRCYIKTI